MITVRKAQKITKMESKVDRYEDELGTYLVQLNNKDLSEHRQSQCFHDASLHR